MIAPQASVIKLTIADLGGLDAGKYSGGQRRFYCPVHGGSRQRSLSIIDDGDSAGVGTCHNCHAKVIITDWPGRNFHAQRPPSVKQLADQLLHPTQARAALPARQPTERAAHEIDTLRALHDRMIARSQDDRAIAYLAGRGLSLAPDDTALIDAAGLGYIPAGYRAAGMGKWADRLIFPLWTPHGLGYAGRALWGWAAGMDESEHKRLLNTYADECQQGERFNEHRRWEKSDPAGWYGEPPAALAESLFIVEGPLDRLALLDAGVDPCEVIALVGTALSVDLLPRNVKRVILALDGDPAGQEAAQKSADAMAFLGILTAIAAPAADGLGKDASERYRRAGSAGLAYIFDAWAQVQERPASAPAPMPSPPPMAAPILPSEPTAQPMPASAPAPSINDGMFPDIALPADAPSLDPVLMRDLFHACPWYDDNMPADAPSRAAMWVCAGEQHPSRPHAMAVYGLLLRLFAGGAPIVVTPGIASHIGVTPSTDPRNTTRTPVQLGLAPFVALLRTAYATHNHSMARACVDAALSGETAQASQAHTFGQRVRQFMESGLGYFAACQRVTAANMAALANS